MFIAGSAIGGLVTSTSTIRHSVMSNSAPNLLHSSWHARGKTTSVGMVYRQHHLGLAWAHYEHHQFLQLWGDGC
jgi:hypothetical protein